MAKERCIFCTPAEELEDELNDLIHTDIDAGIFGEYELSVYVAGVQSDPYLGCTVTDNGDLIYEKTPISYCPKCGRKLR